MQVKWKDKQQAYGDALAYLKGRMKGEIKSFKTPWSKMNFAGVNGFEWGTTVIIGGRPGTFKSTLKDLIFNKAKEFNPNEKFKILDFQFEMSPRVNVIRELASVTKTSYKDLCSAEQPLSRETLAACVNHANKRVMDKSCTIDTVEEQCTTLEFKQIVEEYMEANKDPETGEYTNTLIGLDHTRFLKRDSFEFSEEEVISNAGKMFTYLKKKYPLILFILSQLNRDIERPERNEDRKASNYPTSSDLFGSDGLYQNADVCLILNRPSLKNIRYYGTKAFIIDNEGLLAVHYLKCRNGETFLTFMQADGTTMDIYEIEPPPSAIERMKNMNGVPIEKKEQKESKLPANDLFTTQTNNQ